MATDRCRTHIGGDAGKDQLLDVPFAQDLQQPRRGECAVRVLIERFLPLLRRQPVDGVLPVLSADQQPAHRPRVSDRRARRLAAP